MEEGERGREKGEAGHTDARHAVRPPPAKPEGPMQPVEQRQADPAWNWPGGNRPPAGQGTARHDDAGADAVAPRSAGSACAERGGGNVTTSPRAATMTNRRAAASAGRNSLRMARWRWRGRVGAGNSSVFLPAPNLETARRPAERDVPGTQAGHGHQHGENALQRFPVFLDCRVPVHQRSPSGLPAISLKGEIS